MIGHKEIFQILKKELVKYLHAYSFLCHDNFFLTDQNDICKVWFFGKISNSIEVLTCILATQLAFTCSK